MIVGIIYLDFSYFERKGGFCLTMSNEDPDQLAHLFSLIWIYKRLSIAAKGLMFSEVRYKRQKADQRDEWKRLSPSLAALIISHIFTKLGSFEFFIRSFKQINQILHS